MSRRGDHNVTAVEITTGDSCGRLSPLIVMDRTSRAMTNVEW